MELEINGQAKEVKEFQQFTLEQFFQKTQPEKLEVFNSLFGADQLEDEIKAVEQESDLTLKQLTTIDILYRKMIINQCTESELEKVIKEFLDSNMFQGGFVLLAHFNSLSIEMAKAELFSIALLHSIRVKEIEQMMFEYLNSKEDEK